MNFGTYHTFQCPPWTSPAQVFREEMARIQLAEELGYASVWVPEQHFFDYCLCGDALQMAAYVLGQTRRVRVGTAIVNLTFTHPLRFTERIAILDQIGGGRVDVGVGRGYQWPQYPVMGVDIETTRELFDESLDIVLQAWQPIEFAHSGDFYNIPPVRLWPVPERSADEVLLHASASPESMDKSVARGLPAIFSNFVPIETEASAFSEYRAKLESSEVDADRLLKRATVMRYVFVAESKEEARALAKEPFEWHMSRLNALTTAPEGTAIGSYAMYDREQRAESIPDIDYHQWTESILIFDDAEGCTEKLVHLQDAGVENVVVWMGVGGMAHEHVVRSMQLFAERVMPHLR
jgi:alkanesulfonate monooxygenase SsuD/methylene tetrahydromethanopterin reductase-like flavin-dependent oxidoreductase (luciferase family)